MRRYSWLWLHCLSAVMSIFLLLSSGNITVFIFIIQIPIIIACGLHYYFNIVEYTGLPKPARGRFLPWEQINKGILSYVTWSVCIISCLADMKWLDIAAVTLLWLLAVSIIAVELITIRLNTDFAVRRMMSLKASFYTIAVLFCIGILGASRA